MFVYVHALQLVCCVHNIVLLHFTELVERAVVRNESSSDVLFLIVILHILILEDSVHILEAVFCIHVST